MAPIGSNAGSTDLFSPRGGTAYGAVATPRRSGDISRARFDKALRRLVGFIQRHPDSPRVEAAIDRLARLLAKQFPPQQYETLLTPGELKQHLLAGLRGQRPVILAFVRKWCQQNGLCTWAIDLVELAGIGVVIEDLVPSITTPENGTWRGQTGTLKRSICLEPFGRAAHQWSCPIGQWRGGRITLTYCGYYGEQLRFVKAHARLVCPG